MKLKSVALVGLLTIAAAGTVGWFSLDKETRGILAEFPTNRDVLFWKQSQRDAAFRAFDRLPFLAKHRVVPAGATPSPLPPGPPLALALDVDAYMQDQRSAALMVVHDGKVRLERYGLDFDAEGRWTSFSVAKSITSTLVGAAVRDGFIKSMDDKVSDYIEEMKGSAYDDVSIRQLLTKTSGIQWNEDYGDRNSDVARFGQFILGGARVNGQSIVPEGWLQDATTTRTRIGVPGRGYGYQWWTYDDGTIAARGIFGQGIFIDPVRQLVIVSNANWRGGARDAEASAARDAFYAAVQQAVDDERASASR